MAAFSENTVQEAFGVRYRFTELNEFLFKVAYGKNSRQLKGYILRLLEHEEEAGEDEYSEDAFNADWRQVSYVFIMQMLHVIYEETLTNEIGCTLAELRTAFENEILQERFPETHQKLQPEEIDWIVTYLVRDTLQNGGKAYMHMVPDFENKGFRKETFKIVEDQKIDVGNGVGYYYKATNNTINYFLHTYEIDQQFDFNLQAMIIQEEFKRRNYRNTERSLIQYLSMIRMMIEEYEDFRRRVRRNIVSVGSAELNEATERFLKTVEEAVEGNKRIQRAWQKFETEEIISSTEFNDIRKTTTKIKKLIHSIDTATKQLYDRKYTMQEDKREAIERRNARLLRSKTLDFESAILEKIPQMKDIWRLEDIFMPLYKTKTIKIHTPAVAYLPQKEYGNTGTYQVETFDETDRVVDDQNKDKDIREAIAEYMLRHFEVGESVPYKELVIRMQRDEMGELISQTAFFVQSLCIYSESYTSDKLSVTISAKNGYDIEPCRFVAEKDGKQIEMENILITITKEEALDAVERRLP